MSSTNFEPCTYYGPNASPPSPPTMTPKEEHVLFLRYVRRRTPAVKELLIRKYLCWAFRMATKFKGPRLSFDEAVSVANSALVEALNRFDPTRGYRFTTYATFVVRRRLIEAIVATYPVKVPDHLRKQLRKLHENAPQAELREQENPRTLPEVFERLAASNPVSSWSCVGARKAAFDEDPTDPDESPLPVSDEPYSVDPQAKLETPRSPGDELEEKDEFQTVRDALSSLDSTSSAVVSGRLLSSPPLTYPQLAKKLRIPKSKIREIFQLAVVHLRRNLDPKLAAEHARLFTA